MSHASHDIVIIGGGHNGLTAAAYLARAGRSVLVLERDDHVGGAAVSAQAFAGVDARLSRYSYLVSLLPKRIIDDLDLQIALARRRYSSYTPDPRDPSRGLLVDNEDTDVTAASFVGIGADADGAAWNAFYDDTARIARAIFPSVTEPLPTRSEARRLLNDDELWNAFFERPLGEEITARFSDDLVRGVAVTDGLIGTFTSPASDTLDANRCFIYHVIGNGTGDWDVPIGGMGAVSGELERAAREAGARIVTGAEVTAVDPDGTVRYRRGDVERAAHGERILANVAPFVLERLLGEGAGLRAFGKRSAPDDVEKHDSVTSPDLPQQRAAAFRAVGKRSAPPEGAQVKVNLMLTRLPRLKDESVSPEAAFGGTFHINELYTQLDTAFEGAEHGELPELIPCEIYCHSLSDSSILDPELAESGAHTLTVFGLHTPSRLITPENNDEMRARMQAAVLASLDSVLADPIADVVMHDANGEPCIETKTTLDIERAVGMPGGNIFHGPLSWPFLEDDEPRGTAAERWGVATQHPRILICGSGARRGGAVSGIGGHNAAMAVLEEN